MSSTTNIETNTDSSKEIRLLFDRFFQKEISFSSNQVDSVIGFFRSRGFDELASISVAAVLLQQAKLDNVNVFELLDTLKFFDKIQLSNLVTAILNNSRSKLSKIGYRIPNAINVFESRNILY
jgi:hypothetical protein